MPKRSRSNESNNSNKNKKQKSKDLQNILLNLNKYTNSVIKEEKVETPYIDTIKPGDLLFIYKKPEKIQYFVRVKSLVKSETRTGVYWLYFTTISYEHPWRKFEPVTRLNPQREQPTMLTLDDIDSNIEIYKISITGDNTRNIFSFLGGKKRKTNRKYITKRKKTIKKYNPF